ncbi:hypothetical protein CKA38_11830 [Ereboglobus luteus]|uniref:Uncharacterized protein n=1 Tax=Ereboglobus luteus TaxID=1796921 RepID=A0A2U8E4U1_9BACT|nr:hypothetical protein CKA38_11830 [Ereboglobus luteus]
MEKQPAISVFNRHAALRWLSPASKFACALAAFAFGIIANAAPLGKNNTVTIVNGIGRPYTVYIDGKPHVFEEGAGVLHLSFPSGKHTVRASIEAPGGAVDYKGEFEIDGGSLLGGLFNKSATIINPDRTAVILYAKIGISKAGTPDAQYVYDDKSTVHVGEDIIQVPVADYYFSDKPDMASSWTGWRSHVDMLRLPPASMVAYIEGVTKRSDAVAYLNRLGRLNPSDRRVSMCAAHYLTPAEAERFFKMHLDTRPVQVPWHESYQNYLRSQPPSNTMDSHYRPLLAGADLDDGALLYVIARGIDRRDNYEVGELYRKALRAKKPCASAWLALASEAEDLLDFDLALVRLEKAEQSNVDTTGAGVDRIALLLALGRKDEALETVKRLRNENPFDFFAMAKYMHLLGYCGGSEEEKDAAINGYELAPDVEVSYRHRMDAVAVLEAAYCYGKGDSNGYVHNLQRIAEAPWVMFNRALIRGDHRQARAVLDKSMADNFYNWLLLYIVACEHGDTVAAEQYFTLALEKMKRGMKGPRWTAESIEQTGDANPAVYIQSQYTPQVKRVLFCAFGWRFPARREAFFHWARRMNYEVEFPRLLLEQNMQCQNSFLWTVR